MPVAMTMMPMNAIANAIRLSCQRAAMVPPRPPRGKTRLAHAGMTRISFGPIGV
jgi:hypothetical protein